MAVLLVGGMGTRLRSVCPALPKPLAPIGNQSFLHLLVRQLRSQSIKRVVMCTGHLADQIESQFGDGHDWGMEIQYSKEMYPRGTAGAIKLADRYLACGGKFLVLNGDSFLDVDFSELIDFHRRHGGLVTIAGCRVANTMRYGTVCIDTSNRVTAFKEKTGVQTPGLVNSGVYVFSPSILEHIPDGAASLERDIIPRLLHLGVYALEQQGLFIDIGTPDDYYRAREIYDDLDRLASRKPRSGHHDI